MMTFTSIENLLDQFMAESESNIALANDIYNACTCPIDDFATIEVYGSYSPMSYDVNYGWQPAEYPDVEVSGYDEYIEYIVNEVCDLVREFAECELNTAEVAELKQLVGERLDEISDFMVMSADKFEELAIQSAE